MPLDLPPKLASPPTSAWWYAVGHRCAPDGWHVQIQGSIVVWRSGPHESLNASEHEVYLLVRRWMAKAAKMGGYVMRPGGGICIVLPAHVERPRGALDRDHAPGTRFLAQEDPYWIK